MSGTILTRIQKARNDGANVYIDDENVLPKTDYYRVEMTELAITENDCYNIQGSYEPKSEVLDKIAEANGIIFTFGEVVQRQIMDGLYIGKDGKPLPRTVYIGRTDGKRVVTDGAEVNSGIMEYELDPAIRAIDDCVGATVYSPETCFVFQTAQKKSMAKAFMTFSKFGRQLANTRARNRVIRKLVGLPIGFKAADLKKPFVFARIVPNLQAIASTPAGAILAASKALNMDISALFGAKKSELISGLQIPAPQLESPENAAPPEGNPENPGSTAADLAAKAADNSGETMPFGDEDDGGKFEKLTAALEEYAIGYKQHLDVTTSNGNNPYRMAMAELENKNATVESRRSMVEKVKNWLVAMKVPGAA
jgi:hypothetical protein